MACGTGFLFSRDRGSAPSRRLLVDHQPRPPPSANSKTMPAPPPNLTDLPIEILERIFLCLPGQDIIKIETVRSVTPISIRTFVDFALYDLGQPTHSRPHS